MVKTLRELATTESFTTESYEIPVVDIENVVNLLKFVREQTLIEAANKADADYNIIDENEPDDPVEKDQIEVYVLKESILGLDKNSIEI